MVMETHIYMNHSSNVGIYHSFIISWRTLSIYGFTVSNRGWISSKLKPPFSFLPVFLRSKQTWGHERKGICWHTEYQKYCKWLYPYTRFSELWATIHAFWETFPVPESIWLLEDSPSFTGLFAVCCVPSLLPAFHVLSFNRKAATGTSKPGTSYRLGFALATSPCCVGCVFRKSGSSLSSSLKPWPLAGELWSNSFGFICHIIRNHGVAGSTDSRGGINFTHN